MTRAVRLTRSALHDLDEIHQWISLDSLGAADRWLNEIEAHVVSLAAFPNRNRKAPEALRFKANIRHLVVGNYRVIYEVTPREVLVLHVRHAARRPVRRKPK